MIYACVTSAVAWALEIKSETVAAEVSMHLEHFFFLNAVIFHVDFSSPIGFASNRKSQPQQSCTALLTESSSAF